MTLPDVALNDPHVAAHNDEREAINKLQDLSDPTFQANLLASTDARIAEYGVIPVLNQTAAGYPVRPGGVDVVRWRGPDVPPSMAVGDIWDQTYYLIGA